MLQEAPPSVQEEDPFTYSCPSTQTLFPNNPSFAKTIRDGYKYLTGVGRAFQSSPVRCVCVCVHCSHNNNLCCEPMGVCVC